MRLYLLTEELIQKSRNLISGQVHRLRNRLLLSALRKRSDGILPDGTDSGSCRVNLIPPPCSKDGLRVVSLFLLFPIRVLLSHTFFFSP